MSSEEEYSDSGSEEEEEWTNDHLKLLFLLSNYAKQAVDPDDQEGWVRKNSLIVLMYEAIVAGVLDYDYSPCSMLIGRCRVWMNVTQEGKDDLDDLREGGLLNALKLASEDLIPVTAYQVSKKGMDLLKLVPNELKDDVDAVIHGRDGHEEELLGVEWNAHEDEDDDEDPGFTLYTEGGYLRKSDITETEDVSYVSSPYVAECLRGSEKPMTDNSGRAHESAAGESDLKDELSEAITLQNLHAYVGEWIPFGSNQIVSLNDKLGSADRCQGGMFTGTVDKEPTGTSFSVPTGLTSVSILDYDETEFINFEAEINYPESPGIIQVENFGMHLSEDGFLCYAMKIEAIQDRLADDISIDMLSRLLVDVHQDSSNIADSLLSFYQKGLLSMIYMDDELMRDKYNLLVAEGIEPKMEASRYMDREEHENELKQVLGDTDCAYNLSPDDILIRGRNGLLIVGPNSRAHEILLVRYLSLMGREMFVRTFFIRAFVLSNLLIQIRKLINNADKDPNTGTVVRSLLSTAARDIISLQEVLGYLEESLMDVTVPPRPDDLPGKRLFTILDLDGLKAQLQFRIDDLEKGTKGALNELTNLTSSMDVISTKQLEQVFKKIESNTKSMVDAIAADERASASLEVMEIIFSASMGFDIMIRMFGIDQGTNAGVGHVICGPDKEEPGYTEDGILPWTGEGTCSPNGWQYWTLKNIVFVPGGWFCMNMLFTFFVCSLLKSYMAHLGELSTNFVQIEKVVKAEMDVDELKNYLSTKTIEVSGGDEARNTKITTWTEEDGDLWGGALPKITLAYDEVHGFLLTARMDVDKKKVTLPEEVMETMDVEMWMADRLVEVLREQNVLYAEGQSKKKKLGGMLG